MAIQDTDTFLVARGTANYQVAGSVLKAYAGGSGTQPSIPDVAAVTYGSTGLKSLVGVTHNPVNGTYTLFTREIGDIASSPNGISILVSTDGENFNQSAYSSVTASNFEGVQAFTSTGATGFIYGSSSGGVNGVAVQVVTNPATVAGRVPNYYVNTGTNVVQSVNSSYGPCYYEQANAASVVYRITVGNPITSYQIYSAVSTDDGYNWSTRLLYTDTTFNDSPTSYQPRGTEAAYIFTSTGLYKTTDGGYNFTKKTTPLPGGVNNNNGSVGASGTGNLLTVAYQSTSYRLYYSTDDGLTWNTSSGISDAPAKRVFYSDLADRYIVFTSTGSGSGASSSPADAWACYISTDSTGASFRLAAPGNPWLQSALGGCFNTGGGGGGAVIGLGTFLYFIPMATSTEGNGYLCVVDPRTL